MGFPAEVKVNFREEGRVGLDIESDGSGILIGKQGKTLEALQFIVNLAAGRMGAEPSRIVLDTQDYRSRRERSLIRMANQVAEQVRRSRGSQLLEPLNPFERRLIHTSLARYGDIETVSEGDGLYKRIRVICRKRAGRPPGVDNADLRIRMQGMSTAHSSFSCDRTRPSRALPARARVSSRS